LGLPAGFFDWRAFFADLAFLAVLRLPFGSRALVSGVSAVSIVFVFIRLSPGPGCGRHIDHSVQEKLQGESLVIWPAQRFRVGEERNWRAGSLF
jgi:hypothetical protein